MQITGKERAECRFADPSWPVDDHPQVPVFEAIPDTPQERGKAFAIIVGSNAETKRRPRFNEKHLFASAPLSVSIASCYTIVRAGNTTSLLGWLETRHVS